MREALCSLTLIVAAAAGPARAQSDAVVVSPPEVEAMHQSMTEARVAELEQAYQDVNLRGPRAGVVVSSLTLWGGSALLFAGALSNHLFCDERSCRTASGNAMAATGGVIMLGSVAGIIVSAIKLHRGKDKRRRLKYEIRALQPPSAAVLRW